jgi:hypothetical protein
MDLKRGSNKLLTAAQEGLFLALGGHDVLEFPTLVELSVRVENLLCSILLFSCSVDVLLFLYRPCS